MLDRNCISTQPGSLQSDIDVIYTLKPNISYLYTKHLLNLMTECCRLVLGVKM